MQKLSASEIRQAMERLNGWTLEPNETTICNEWHFESFKRAIGFIVKVGDIADSQDHHPELLSIYTKIRIRLSTHDASGLTQKDIDQAISIDTLFASQFSRSV